ncbi:hypothetical protein F2Q69_00020916 [Brassica cretica]|uniref:Uncharacterized protein n=1 Tax=Brassica cretica TaxID=69181 RepID=A0A8S9Q5Q3_BRACR|nr:hypothetical protein F2Q69_00020916 [Brassica cretica]
MDSGIVSLSGAVAWASEIALCGTFGKLRFSDDHVYPPAGTIVSKVILPSSAFLARLVCACVPLGRLFISTRRAVGIQDKCSCARPGRLLLRGGHTCRFESFSFLWASSAGCTSGRGFSSPLPLR